MSSLFKEKILCPKCNSVQETEIYTSINVTVDPTLKEPFLNKKINWMKCVSCDTEVFIPIEFVYHDMNKEFLVIFKHPNSSSKNTEDGFAEFAERLNVANYMSFPVVVNHPYGLILAVELCDKKRGPKSKEEAEELSLFVNNATKELNP